MKTGQAPSETRAPGRLEAVPAVAVAPHPAASARPGPFRPIFAADEWLLLRMKRWHGPWRTRLARGLTAAGDGKSWTVVSLALLATRTPAGVHAGLRIAAATLLATLLSQALKRGLNRPRPTRAIEGFTALAENPDSFSFPSGHTAAASAVAVALAGQGHGLGPASLALAAGIGLSRVYLGAHYPLDVAAGAVLGAAAGALARLLLS